MLPDLDYLTGLLSLEGKVAVVTGARLGIGAAVATAMARAGAAVCVTSREPRRMAPVLGRIEAAGSDSLAVGLDVRKQEEIESAVDAIVARFGRLDILVNNAGTSARGPALDHTPNDWDEVLETNLRGAFFMAQAAARAMRKTGGGVVINLSSTFAQAVVADRAAYSASKAGLDHLTRVLAKEWAPYRIRVNGVAPATVATESRPHLASGEARRTAISQIPLGRLATPDDVVPAVLFLAGPAGAFVTGQTLCVDGGFTLR